MLIIDRLVGGMWQVKRHWGQQAGKFAIGRGLHWTEHVAVQRRINAKVSGDPAIDPYQRLIGYLGENGMKLPLDRCLTLGCGGGELERGLAKYNFCRRHDAYDVADRAIELAQETARSQGLRHINYRVADINRLSLPADTYDVVFTVMSAHHFANLEHVFGQVRSCLRPCGVFFLNEFIGPTKFQWSDRQLEIVNSLLRVLPARFRTTKNGRPKANVRRPMRLQMKLIDPSEAIRSGEIVEVLSRLFDIVEKQDYGGTILHLLLDRIAFNFDPAAENDMRLLQMVFHVEDQLLAAGDIASDFATIIARPKVRELSAIMGQS